MVYKFAGQEDTRVVFIVAVPPARFIGSRMRTIVIVQRKFTTEKDHLSRRGDCADLL